MIPTLLVYHIHDVHNHSNINWLSYWSRSSTICDAFSFGFSPDLTWRVWWLPQPLYCVSIVAKFFNQAIQNLWYCLIHVANPSYWHKFNCLISTCRDDFKSFVEVCFEEFGDRVKHWITLNEPYFYSTSTKYPLVAAQNLLLAHAAAVKLYKKNYQVQNWRTINPNLLFFLYNVTIYLLLIEMLMEAGFSKGYHRHHIKLYMVFAAIG